MAGERENFPMPVAALVVAAVLRLHGRVRGTVRPAIEDGLRQIDQAHDENLLDFIGKSCCAFAHVDKFTAEGLFCRNGKSHFSVVYYWRIPILGMNHAGRHLRTGQSKI